MAFLYKSSQIRSYAQGWEKVYILQIIVFTCSQICTIEHRNSFKSTPMANLRKRTHTKWRRGEKLIIAREDISETTTYGELTMWEGHGIYAMWREHEEKRRTT